MTQTIIAVATLFLMTGSVVHADGRWAASFDPGIKPLEPESQLQDSNRLDMNISPQKYVETYSRNRKYAQSMLMSYSKNTLDRLGVPRQGRNVMGAALGLAINNGLVLDLNASETLALEFKGVNQSNRALFFRIKVDW